MSGGGLFFRFPPQREPCKRMLYGASLITSLLRQRAGGGRINRPQGAGGSLSSRARDKPVSEINRLGIRGLSESNRD
jgi:hypothetical protein